MAARTKTRNHSPAVPGLEIRLPWWAVVLPALAFAALLLLVVEPGQAHAATADPVLGRLFERLVGLLPA
ncbi:hypothetical protein [Streptomyces sp. NPDC059166]|uniref:hypothetical protein n=1 Tax=Streptomyces sp. NPDC059166 TaxID=3346752 RepID=UPI0036C3E969